MVYVLGNNDRIAIPNPVRVNGMFGGEAKYTHPSFDWCYTSHGFIVGLDAEGKPLHLLLDDALPIIPVHMHQVKCLCEYLLIDFDGRVWKVFVAIAKENVPPIITHHYIYTNQKSWWLASPSDDISLESESLFGFLATNPSEKAVADFWFATNKGETLSWFSISDIVERLNNEFPDKKTRGTRTDIAEGLQLLQKLIDIRSKKDEES